MKTICFAVVALLAAQVRDRVAMCTMMQQRTIWGG